MEIYRLYHRNCRIQDTTNIITTQIMHDKNNIYDLYHPCGCDFSSANKTYIVIICVILVYIRSYNAIDACDIN